MQLFWLSCTVFFWVFKPVNCNVVGVMNFEDFKDGLVQIYYKLEDKYYDVLDFFNDGLHIPVYDAIVNPIESRGIPSFPVVSGVLLLLIIGSIIGAFLLLNPSQTVNLQLKVSANGNPVDEAFATLAIEGFEPITATVKDGSAILFNVPVGMEARLTVSKNGFKAAVSSISTNQQSFEISLESLPQAANQREKPEDCFMDNPFENKARLEAESVKNIRIIPTQNQLVVAITPTKRRNLEGKGFKCVDPKPVELEDEPVQRIQTTATLKVMVLESNVPINAKVTLLNENEEMLASKDTSSGIALFELKVPAEGMTVRAIANSKEKPDDYSQSSGSTLLIPGGAEVLKLAVEKLVKSGPQQNAEDFNILVVDGEDKPLNADVLVQELNNTEYRLIPFRFESLKPNVNQFTLTAIKAKTYKLTAFKNGYLYYTITLTFGHTEKTKKLILFKANGENNATIIAKVKDDAGKPVAGAKIIVSDQDGPLTTELNYKLTDSNGSAKINYPPGLKRNEKYFLKAFARIAEENVEGSAEVQANAAENNVEIILSRPKATIQVTGRDANGNLIGRAVNVSIFNPQTNSTEANCIANPTCDLQVKVLSYGEKYELKAYADFYDNYIEPISQLLKKAVVPKNTSLRRPTDIVSISSQKTSLTAETISIGSLKELNLRLHVKQGTQSGFLIIELNRPKSPKISVPLAGIVDINAPAIGGEYRLLPEKIEFAIPEKLNSSCILNSSAEVIAAVVASQTLIDEQRLAIISYNFSKVKYSTDYNISLKLQANDIFSDSELKELGQEELKVSATAIAFYDGNYYYDPADPELNNRNSLNFSTKSFCQAQRKELQKFKLSNCGDANIACCSSPLQACKSGLQCISNAIAPIGICKACGVLGAACCAGNVATGASQNYCQDNLQCRGIFQNLETGDIDFSKAKCLAPTICESSSGVTKFCNNNNVCCSAGGDLSCKPFEACTGTKFCAGANDCQGNACKAAFIQNVPQQICEIPLGGRDQPCRSDANNKCDTGLTCTAGFCRECGGIGQQCCESSESGVAKFSCGVGQCFAQKVEGKETKICKPPTLCGGSICSGGEVCCADLASSDIQSCVEASQCSENKGYKVFECNIASDLTLAQGCPASGIDPLQFCDARQPRNFNSVQCRNCDSNEYDNPACSKVCGNKGQAHCADGKCRIKNEALISLKNSEEEPFKKFYNASTSTPFICTSCGLENKPETKIPIPACNEDGSNTLPPQNELSNIDGLNSTYCRAAFAKSPGKKFVVKDYVCVECGAKGKPPCAGVCDSKLASTKPLNSNDAVDNVCTSCGDHYESVCTGSTCTSGGNYNSDGICAEKKTVEGKTILTEFCNTGFCLSYEMSQEKCSYPADFGKEDFLTKPENAASIENLAKTCGAGSGRVKDVKFQDLEVRSLKNCNAASCWDSTPKIEFKIKATSLISLSKLQDDEVQVIVESKNSEKTMIINEKGQEAKSLTLKLKKSDFTNKDKTAKISVSFKPIGRAGEKVNDAYQEFDSGQITVKLKFKETIRNIPADLNLKILKGTLPQVVSAVFSYGKCKEFKIVEKKPVIGQQYIETNCNEIVFIADPMFPADGIRITEYDIKSCVIPELEASILPLGADDKQSNLVGSENLKYCFQISNPQKGSAKINGGKLNTGELDFDSISQKAIRFTPYHPNCPLNFKGTNIPREGTFKYPMSFELKLSCGLGLVGGPSKLETRPVKITVDAIQTASPILKYDVPYEPKYNTDQPIAFQGYPYGGSTAPINSLAPIGRVEGGKLVAVIDNRPDFVKKEEQSLGPVNLESKIGPLGIFTKTGESQPTAELIAIGDKNKVGNDIKTKYLNGPEINTVGLKEFFEAASAKGTESNDLSNQLTTSCTNTCNPIVAGNVFQRFNSVDCRSNVALKTENDKQTYCPTTPDAATKLQTLVSQWKTLANEDLCDKGGCDDINNLGTILKAKYCKTTLKIQPEGCKGYVFQNIENKQETFCEYDKTETCPYRKLLTENPQACTTAIENCKLYIDKLVTGYNAAINLNACLNVCKNSKETAIKNANEVLSRLLDTSQKIAQKTAFRRTFEQIAEYSAPNFKPTFDLSELLKEITKDKLVEVTSGTESIDCKLCKPTDTYPSEANCNMQCKGGLINVAYGSSGKKYYASDALKCSFDTLKTILCEQESNPSSAYYKAGSDLKKAVCENKEVTTKEVEAEVNQFKDNFDSNYFYIVLPSGKVAVEKSSGKQFFADNEWKIRMEAPTDANGNKLAESGELPSYVCNLPCNTPDTVAECGGNVCNLACTSDKILSEKKKLVFNGPNIYLERCNLVVKNTEIVCEKGLKEVIFDGNQAGELVINEKKIAYKDASQSTVGQTSSQIQPQLNLPYDLFEKNPLKFSFFVSVDSQALNDLKNANQLQDFEIPKTCENRVGVYKFETQTKDGNKFTNLESAGDAKAKLTLATIKNWDKTGCLKYAEKEAPIEACDLRVIGDVGKYGYKVEDIVDNKKQPTSPENCFFAGQPLVKTKCEYKTIMVSDGGFWESFTLQSACKVNWRLDFDENRLLYKLGWFKPDQVLSKGGSGNRCDERSDKVSGTLEMNRPEIVKKLVAPTIIGFGWKPQYVHKDERLFTLETAEDSFCMFKKATNAEIIGDDTIFVCPWIGIGQFGSNGISGNFINEKLTNDAALSPTDLEYVNGLAFRIKDKPFLWKFGPDVWHYKCERCTEDAAARASKATPTEVECRN